MNVIGFNQWALNVFRFAFTHVKSSSSEPFDILLVRQTDPCIEPLHIAIIHREEYARLTLAK
jgi:hypothetical protein